MPEYITFDEALRRRDHARDEVARQAMQSRSGSRARPPEFITLQEALRRRQEVDTRGAAATGITDAERFIPPEVQAERDRESLPLIRAELAAASPEDRPYLERDLARRTAQAGAAPARKEPVKWSTIAESPEYLDLGADDREAVRLDYFARVVAPTVPTADLAAVKADFDERTKPSALKTAADVAKTVGGSLVKGAGGALVRGVGEVMREGGQALASGLNAATGTDFFRAANPLDAPAGALERAGDSITDSRSTEARRAQAGSTPTGNVFTGENLSFGDNPTLYGYVLQGATLLGQFAPQLAAAYLTRGRSVAQQLTAGGAVGGATGGGAAAQQARETIAGLDDAQLAQQSKAYRDLVASGVDPATARARVSDAAEQWAFRLTTPISAAGGAATGAVLGRAGGDALRAVAPGVAGRTAAGAAVSGTEEAVQELGENTATNAGINRGAGTSGELGEGSFASVVLGALGGGAIGAVKGATTRGAAGSQPAGSRGEPLDAERLIDPLPEQTPAQPEQTRPALPALPAPSERVIPAQWEVADGQAIAGPPASPAQQPAPQALPAPEGPAPIMVDSAGNAAPQPSAARTEALDRALAQQLDDERTQRAARAVGLTPDVERAQQSHPAYEPADADRRAEAQPIAEPPAAGATLQAPLPTAEPQSPAPQRAVALPVASPVTKPPIESPTTRRARDIVSRLVAAYPGAGTLGIEVAGSATEHGQPANTEGFYDRSRGRVVLFADSMTRDGQLDERRVAEVFAHEVVGHHGVESLVRGPEFDELASSVLRTMTAKGGADGIRQRGNLGADGLAKIGSADYATADAVRLAYPEANETTVAMEVVARLAETGAKPGFVGRAVAMVRRALRPMFKAAGIEFRMSDAEIKALVVRAARQMTYHAETVGSESNAGKVQELRAQWPAVERPRDPDADQGGARGDREDRRAKALDAAGRRVEGNPAPRAAEDEVARSRRSLERADPGTSALTSGPLDALIKHAGGTLVRDWVTDPVITKVIEFGSRIVPERWKMGLVSDFGLDEHYLDARVGRDAAFNRRLRAARRVLDGVADLDRGQSRIAYLWMNEKPDTELEQQLMNRLPPPARERLRAIKEMVDELGRAAVDVGLLSEDSYQRNRMAYLHRSYQQHEEQRGKTGGSAASIRGDSYKGRGIREYVSGDDLVQHIDELKPGDKVLRVERRGPSGRLVERRYIAAGAAIPAGFTAEKTWEARYFDRKGKVGLWRDLSADERQKLGEIDEVRYAFARTVLAAARDIENERFLRWVADTYANDAAPKDKLASPSDGYLTAKTYRRDEWVTVPDTSVPGTQLKKFGALAGHTIPGPVWNDVRGQMQVPESELGQLYDKMLRAWKVSRTALSPGVHVNNVASNFILADLAEVRARDVVGALRTLIAAKRGDAEAKTLVERFQDSGAELGSFAAAELNEQFVRPLLDDLEREQASDMGLLRASQVVSLAAHGKVGEALKAALMSPAGRAAALPFKTLMHAYAQEDGVFRLAKFMREVEAGVSDLEAGKAAREAFLDYRINAPWVQAARRTALPFIAFSYRAIPLLIEGVRSKPWKAAKYMATFSALNALTYAMLGSAGDEDRERRRLGPELQGSSLGLFPRMVRLPWNDEHGSPVFLDIRRWVPAGDVFDVTGSHSAVPLPQWLTWGGPLSIFAELMSNVSTFTGREIVKATDSAGEATAKVLDHLFKAAAPNLPMPGPGYIVPGADEGQGQTYSWRAIERALRGRSDEAGRPESLPRAALGAVGVKVRAEPENLARRNAALRFRAKERALDAELMTIEREHARKGISEAERDERRARNRSKLRQAAEEAREALR